MPNDSLLLELFVVFVWAKVFGELFARLTLPAVLGEILAGILLGPYALGFVEPSATVNAVAQVGAVFLLFTIGLETSPKALLNVGKKSAEVALLGIVLPFLLGFGFMRLEGESAHEATFIGAAMVATSVGITARVLADLQVLHTRVARVILGAAVFDDVLGMLLLAVVTGLASSGGINWLQLSVVIVESLGFTVAVFLLGPRLVEKVRPRIGGLHTQNAPLILSLALCLGLSVAAQRIGLAAIIGAFLAGLAFAEYSEEWNLQPRVAAINEFLAPYFFFTMGARLDVNVFRHHVWVGAIGVTLLAIVSKLVGCGLPMLREGWKNGLRVGFGMMPRGEVALIVALIGLQMKIVSSAAYAIVIFMTGTTTLLAPPILRMLFRGEHEEAALAPATLKVAGER